MDIPDSEQYHSPARSASDNNNITPEAELQRIQEEQYTLSITTQELEPKPENESLSGYQTDNERYNSLICNTVNLIQEVNTVLATIAPIHTSSSFAQLNPTLGSMMTTTVPGQQESPMIAEQLTQYWEHQAAQ